MADIRETTARLRRTFAYPADGDSESTSGEPQVMDEQEQEALIATLAAQNSRRDAQFSLFLSALPLLASIPYLPALFHSSTALLSLLALSSLASTAYLLYLNPPAVTGIAPLDGWARSSSRDQDRHRQAGHRRPGGGRSILGGDGDGFGFSPPSPVQAWLPYLNLCLCALLVVTGLLASPRDARIGAGLLGLGNLPALVYGVVLIAKVLMAGVDPEGELAALKYEYKGA